MKTHISDLFRYFSYYRRKGHQIGRKVGDLLEVVTGAALLSDPQTKQHLVLEARLPGFSGAEHRVEYAMFADPSQQTIAGLLGHVECKRVGVEQTPGKKGRGALLANGESHHLTYKSHECRIDIDRITKVSINGVLADSFAPAIGQRLIFGTTISGAVFHVPDHGSLRDVHESIAVCKIVEIAEVTAAGVRLLISDCLPGPQTPEKAKQAAFVAVDIRELRFGNARRRHDEQECVSVLVVTEFSHWEAKSRSIVAAYFDRVLSIDDAVIVAAIEQFEDEFGDDFLEMITKKNLIANPLVRELATSVVTAYDGQIFRDMADGNLKRLTMQAGRLEIG